MVEVDNGIDALEALRSQRFSAAILDVMMPKMDGIEMCENLVGKKLDYNYVEKPRKGDHQWYISNISKFKMDYPNWKLTYGIPEILEDIYKQT